MHVPPAFQIDRAASLSFAQARGFGLVCAADGGTPVASPAPFHLDYARDGTPRAAFHLARNNALVNRADGKTRWLLAVSGADAYLSPDWYASPDQVPTWLYQSVHLTGAVSTMSGEGLAEHLTQLSATFENRLTPKPPWTMDKMTAGRRQAMMRAIVGLVMTVDDVQGSFKLNQHKSDADHVAVTGALALQRSPGAREIARQMRAMRQHAFAADQGQMADIPALEGST